MAALRHPNIMVTMMGQDQKPPYRREPGGNTLRRCSNRRGPLPLPRTVSIIKRLASALDCASTRAGAPGRQPSNAFIGPDDHVTLMDFGIVKALTGRMQ
jgi:hypothetical protein